MTDNKYPSRDQSKEPDSHLIHLYAGLRVQQLALSARVEQEGVRAEGEWAISTGSMLRHVMRLPPGNVVVQNIQLLTAGPNAVTSFRTSFSSKHLLQLFE